jgi:hypothetical protein
MSLLRDSLSRLRLGALAAGLALSAGAASAVEGSISFPLHGAAVSGGAATGVVINLPNTGSPNFLVSFVLPRDYKANQPVEIVLYLSGPAGTCTARLVTSQLFRKRIGASIVNSLSGLGENPDVALAGATTVTQTITLRPGAQPRAQRPGDAFLLRIQREADDTADTCGSSVLVLAIDIRYPQL